jgi:hypothetical protein
MKTQTKTIWLKSVNILIAGLFLFQASACAWNYEYQDVMPDYKWETDAIGFAATVGMSFVPAGAGKIGKAYDIGKTGQVVIGAGMGATIGAMPGLLANDGRAATTGLVFGGVSGGIGSYCRASNIETTKSTTNDLHFQASRVGDFGPTPDNPYSTFGFGLGQGGPGTCYEAMATVEHGQALLHAGDYAGASDAFSEASKSFENVSSGWQEYGIPGAGKIENLAKSFGNVSMAAVNLSPQTTFQNIRTSFAAQQAGSTLTSVGTLCWGMQPKDAQFMGMVGSSVAGWTMSANTDAGQSRMKNMYKDINPRLETWAEKQPLKAGAITGLGLGVLQAGATINLYDKVFADDSMSDSTRMQWASLAGNVAGSLAWGGIVGELGQERVIRDCIEQDSLLLEKASEFPKDSKEYKLTMHQADNFADKAMSHNGWFQGMKSAVNGQSWDNVVQQGLSIGISQIAEHNWVKDGMSDRHKMREQTHASNFGNSMGMLLANLPIWPEGPRRNEANLLRETAKKYEERADEFRAKVEVGTQTLAEQLSIGPLDTQVERDFWQSEAETWDTRAQDTSNQASKLRYWHNVRLREPTPITKNKRWDTVLEPVISSLSNVGISSLRESQRLEVIRPGITEAVRNDASFDLLMHDLTVMNVAQLTHAGVVSLFNRKGWKEGGDEFTQICLGKQLEFYGGLLPFSTSPLLSEEKQESLRGSTIYNAAQTNSHLWNFAGVSNFAPHAEAVRKQPRGAGTFNNWRLKAALTLPGNPFTSVSRGISNTSGGLAYSQTIRNMEGLAYTGIKNSGMIAPYGVERVYPELVSKMESEENHRLLGEMDRWLRESSYPAAYAKDEVIRLLGWEISGNRKTAEVELENTITRMKYPLSDTTPATAVNTLQELDVNKPFELVFPHTLVAQEVSPTVHSPQVPHVEWQNLPSLKKKEIVIEHNRMKSLVLPVEISPLPVPVPGKTRDIERPIEKVEQAYTRPRFSYPIEDGTCFPEGESIEDAGMQVSFPKVITEPYQAPVWDVPIEGGVYTSDGSTVPDNGNSSLYDELNYPSSFQDNSYDFEGGIWDPDTQSGYYIDEIVKEPKLPVPAVKKETVKPAVPQPQPVYIPENLTVTGPILSESSLAQIVPPIVNPAPTSIQPDIQIAVAEEPLIPHYLLREQPEFPVSTLTPTQPTNRQKNWLFFPKPPDKVIAYGPNDGEYIVYERKGTHADYIRTLVTEKNEGGYEKSDFPGSVTFLGDNRWTPNDIMGMLQAYAEMPLKERTFFISGEAVSLRDPSFNRANAYGWATWTASVEENVAGVTVSSPRLRPWEEGVGTFVHEYVHTVTPISLKAPWDRLNQLAAGQAYIEGDSSVEWQDDVSHTIDIAVTKPEDYAWEINQGGRYGSHYRAKLELAKKENIISERQYNRVMKYITPVVLEPMIAEPQYNRGPLSPAIDR